MPAFAVDTLTSVFARPVARRLARGTMVGEYRIENRLGEGGMGVVYAAVHPVIGKRVAIKVLHRECSSPETCARFVDEARVVNQIGHPNIVDIFSMGQTPEGELYMVMELLRGESLATRIARGPIALAEACTIISALARALEGVHKHNIVHRDLKPDNVFLVASRGGARTVKLLDFGIAKLGDFDRTVRGALVGTPNYLSPEQARGIPVDARADIYALGCLAFELLTGRGAFQGTSALDVVTKHLRSRPPRPTQFVRSVPVELDDLVVRMLAKHPEDRPALTELIAALDALALRESMRDFAGYLPTAAEAVALPSQSRPRRGHLVALALGTAAIAASLVFLVARATERGAEANARIEPASVAAANVASAPTAPATVPTPIVVPIVVRELPQSQPALATSEAASPPQAREPAPRSPKRTHRAHRRHRVTSPTSPSAVTAEPLTSEPTPTADPPTDSLPWSNRHDDETDLLTLDDI